MSEAAVRVRVAGEADIGLLVDVGARTFFDAFAEGNSETDMESYLATAFRPDVQAAELGDPATTFLVAEVAGEPVGYARLRLGTASHDIDGARPVEIVRFYSDAAWIGRGVGPALMQACLTHAGSLGCDTIWLDVWELNPRAIAFYRKWGFTTVGTAEFHLGGDIQHDLLMARPVGQPGCGD